MAAPLQQQYFCLPHALLAMMQAAITAPLQASGVQLERTLFNGRGQP